MNILRFSNTKDWTVRRLLARQGFDLDILVNDEIPMVRLAVAEQGYGLDILINDENDHVRHVAQNYSK